MNEAPISYLDVIEFWLGNEGLRPEHMGEREQFWFGADPSIDALIKNVLVSWSKPSWPVGVRTGSPNQCLGSPSLLSSTNFPGTSIAAGPVPSRVMHALSVWLWTPSSAVWIARWVSSSGVSFTCPCNIRKDLATQERSVEVSQRQDAERAAAFENFEGKSLNYAREHRDVVARFGRFPHRNKALGRRSTEEELAYLTGGAPDYGQGSAES